MVAIRTQANPFFAARPPASPVTVSPRPTLARPARDTVHFGRFKPYDQATENERRPGWFRRNFGKLALVATLGVSGLFAVSTVQINQSTDQLRRLEALHGSSQYALQQPDGSVLVITSPFSIPAELMQRTATASVEIISPTTPGHISIGSGVVIRAADGQFYILTNNHVTQAPVEAGQENPQYHVRAYGHSSHDLRAEVINTDAPLDMSLMRITTPDFVPENYIDVSRIRDVGEDPLTPNEPVFEVGNPHGANDTVMPGIGFEHSSGNNSLEYLAGCFPGSSGSPIFDLEGNLVGLGKAISSPTGGRCFGVKGDSILQLLKAWGVKLTQR